MPNDFNLRTITTPAWTPLFALAAGVVTDVGGPSITVQSWHARITSRQFLGQESRRSGNIPGSR